jgi:NAD(P)-dependent dehydrogenase (short-subunit alcohol dehydrogenase family)
MNLHGKVAVVTGAAGGLGLEQVKALAHAGATVIAADIADLSQTIEAVHREVGGVNSIVMDVTDASSVAACATQLMALYGRIDVLVNNAALYGALARKPFDQIPEAEFDNCMRVNVKGVWTCSRMMLPALRASASASIVNIASAAAIYGMPYAAHYVASKAAVIGLTRSMSRELGRERIRVNAVAPSVVATDATLEFLGDDAEKSLSALVKAQSLREPVRSTDVADAVVFLSSDHSRMISGQVISVCGGTL